jgi:sugar phosphate permease
MGLNGLFQSVGMPGCCATLGNWFSTAQRGAVVGLWAGCQNFGDIVGFIVAGNLTEMENPWPWGWVMILFSSLMMIMAIVAFLFLRPYPEEVDVY